MNDIVFARTRHKYDSYSDFWKLVKFAGFKTELIDDIDLTKQNYIITTMLNSEWEVMIRRHAGKRRRAHVVLWNLERPVGWAKTIGNYAEMCWDLIHKRWFDEVWVSDRQLAAETELRFVPLGSHPGLGEPGLDKKYAFAHISCIVPRRQAVYSQFEQEVIAPNGWDSARHISLQQSFFALNIHQDQHPFCEPLRFALFAAYGLPVLSERILDPFPIGGQTMEFNNYRGIGAKLRQMLQNDYQRWFEMGQRLQQLLCVDYEFEKVVKSVT